MRDYSIDAGGDVYVAGCNPEGKPWSIGIRHPRCDDQLIDSLRVSNLAVCTSGDYERCFVRDGVRYHHLLDATTGWPARGLASATVIAATTFLAGRFATASFLLGAEAGLSLLEQAPGVEGALITEEGSILATPGMTRLSNLPGSLYAEYPGI